MIETRTLMPEDVAELVSWAGDEGWNPGLDDAAAFRVADPYGFIGAFDGDRLAAGISVVRYGASFGFLGLYISHPDYRGKGYGKAVWAAGMAHLKGRTIGLDGVPELQAYYRSVGFEVAHETLRYAGRPQAPDGAEATTHEVPVDAAYGMDAQCFPAARTAFLQNWLQPPRIVRGVFDGGALRGYGVVRACRVGNKVGPLFADSPETAASILGALTEAVSGEVIVDVPLPQAAFRAMLEGQGMTASFGTARMYKGPPPQIDISKVFGLTTLELG